MRSKNKLAGWLFFLGMLAFLGYLAYLGLTSDSYALAKATYELQSKTNAVAVKPIGQLTKTLCPTINLTDGSVAYSEIKSLFIGLATKEKQPASEWLNRALAEAESYSVVTIEIRTANERLWYIGINSNDENLKKCLSGFSEIIAFLTGQLFKIDTEHFFKTIPIGKAEKDVWTFSVSY